MASWCLGERHCRTIIMGEILTDVELSKKPSHILKRLSMAGIHERIRESPDSSKSRKLTMKDTQLPMGAPGVWGT
jgi:hypothetical protein